jgi:hypothetical protein
MFSLVYRLTLSDRFKEVEDDEKSEGFWSELFLLKPDLPRLREILENTDAEFLIHVQVCFDSNVCTSVSSLQLLQHQPQQLLSQAVAHIKAAQAPLDENALDVSLSMPFQISLPIYDLDLDSILRCSAG